MSRFQPGWARIERLEPRALFSVVPWTAAPLGVAVADLTSAIDGTRTSAGRTVSLTPTTGPALNAEAGLQIEVVFPNNSGLTANQQAVFANAAARWEQIITGDIPDVGASASQWGAAVDDVRINAMGANIDGAGGVLGSAGWDYRRNGTFLPISGTMRFDTADLATLEANGRLPSVILHEMGHVLGLGTNWTSKGLISGAGTSNPRYTGVNATNEFNSIFTADSASVPVEATGGAGTRDAHWRDSTFGTELMTGFIGGTTNPLSRVTAAQFIDLGYPGVVLSVPPVDTYAPANIRPVVASVSESADPIGSGSTLTLTANGVSDPGGAISGVSFYRESNGTADLQARGSTPDTFISTDSDSTGGYTATVSTTGLALGGYTYYARAIDFFESVSLVASTTTSIVAVPAVQSVAINNGNAQRSKVTSITVTFNENVVLDAGAFTLAGRSGAGSATVVNVSPSSGASTIFTLTFSGSPIVGGSLADGIYDLTVVAGKVHGTAASGPAMAADFATEFHRLFSDIDGDGDSDNADLFQFRTTYNKGSADPGFNAAFDFDGDNDVDNSDLLQVRARRGIEFKGY